MRIQLKECEPIGTNAYCLLNDDLKQAILVDAPLGSFEWSIELCREYHYDLSAVLLTHGHWDHILDAHLFNEQKIPIYGHRADSLLFEQPERMMQYAIPGIKIRALEINHWIAADTISVGGFSFEVFEVQGIVLVALCFTLRILIQLLLGMLFLRVVLVAVICLVGILKSWKHLS